LSQREIKEESADLKRRDLRGKEERKERDEWERFYWNPLRRGVKCKRNEGEVLFGKQTKKNKQINYINIDKLKRGR